MTFIYHDTRYDIATTTGSTLPRLHTGAALRHSRAITLLYQIIIGARDITLICARRNMPRGEKRRRRASTFGTHTTYTRRCRAFLYFGMAHDGMAHLISLFAFSHAITIYDLSPNKFWSIILAKKND